MLNKGIIKYINRQHCHFEPMIGKVSKYMAATANSNLNQTMLKINNLILLHNDTIINPQPKVASLITAATTKIIYSFSEFAKKGN